MKKLYLILSIVICSFANIFNANALTLRIDPEAVLDGYNDGSSWDRAFPTVESALQYTNVTNQDVTFLLKYGEHEPIKIHNTRMNSVTIYGAYDEYCGTTADRYLDDPYSRTIIRGTATEPAIWIEGMPAASRNIIDGITLIGGERNESLAIRVVGACEVIFSRCRIQDTNHSGNLIFIEGYSSSAYPQHMVSFVNSIISDNNVTNIVNAFFSCCFINSTIVNDTCNTFMKVSSNQSHYVFDIKNSIVKNTPCNSSGCSVNVYNSSVANFSNFVDSCNNTSGLNIAFEDNEDDPYKHVPNQYITARGNYDYYEYYANIIPDGQLDIIGNRRYERRTFNIDLGAYQSSQTYSRSYAPEFIEEEYEEYETEDMVLNDINIYPTKLNSGETLHFEHNLDNSLFVRIYNLSGIEVVSQDITNNDDIYLSLPSGMYIVTMSNPETEEIVRQEKIVITN
jgi:hypothetical protein